MGDRPGREGWIKELVGGQNSGPEALPRSKKSKRRGSKGDVREERLPVEQWRKMGGSGSLRRRRSEEMTQSNTSYPRGSEVPLESQRGWWQLKSPTMKRFLEEERMEGEKEWVLPSVGEEQIGGTYTIGKESEKELLREMLTLHSQSRGQAKKERRSKVQRRISPA